MKNDYWGSTPQTLINYDKPWFMNPGLTLDFRHRCLYPWAPLFFAQASGDGTEETAGENDMVAELQIGGLPGRPSGGGLTLTSGLPDVRNGEDSPEICVFQGGHILSPCVHA